MVNDTFTVSFLSVRLTINIADFEMAITLTEKAPKYIAPTAVALSLVTALSLPNSFADAQQAKGASPTSQKIVRPVPVEVRSADLAKEMRNSIRQNPTGTAIPCFSCLRAICD